MPRGGVRVRPKKATVDLSDPNLPTCLGWCGGKRFKPRFPYDRYCNKCREKKSALESGMSKREQHAMVAGRSLPDGFYDSSDD